LPIAPPIGTGSLYAWLDAEIGEKLTMDRHKSLDNLRFPNMSTIPYSGVKPIGIRARLLKIRQGNKLAVPEEKDVLRGERGRSASTYLCASQGRLGRTSVANADNLDASVPGLVFSIEVNDHAG
jgi:hypothetical protein